MKLHTTPGARRQRWRGAVAAVTLLASLPALTLVPAPAHAQAQADDATTKAARARFLEGVDAYDKGQYESARASFLQAYALRKHPAVLLNLAQSCLRSGHHFEALKYFQQFLHDSSSVTPAQRSDAEKGIAEARGGIGRLEISAPTGAEISVDGAVVGTAPLNEPVDVEPGSHTVRARLSDGTTDTKTLSPGAGDKLKVVFTPPSSNAAVAAPPRETPEAEAQAAPQEAPEPDVTEYERPAAGTTGLFSPPKSMAPVYIGAGVAVAGFATAVLFGVVFKGNAEDAAASVRRQILDNIGDYRPSDGTGICSSTEPAVVTKFGAACNALRENNDTIDTNALVGNIGVGVGIAGAAFALGWYLFAPKRGAASDEAARGRLLMPKPLVGHGVRGLGLQGSF